MAGLASSAALQHTASAVLASSSSPGSSPARRPPSGGGIGRHREPAPPGPALTPAAAAAAAAAAGQLNAALAGQLMGCFGDLFHASLDVGWQSEPDEDGTRCVQRTAFQRALQPLPLPFTSPIPVLCTHWRGGEGGSRSLLSPLRAHPCSLTHASSCRSSRLALLNYPKARKVHAQGQQQRDHARAGRCGEPHVSEQRLAQAGSQVSV